MPPMDDEQEEGEALWEEDFEEDEGDEDEEEEEGDEELALLVEQADELIETGEARKAVALWRRSIDRYSDEPSAYFHYARACFRLIEEELGDIEELADDSELLPIYSRGLSAVEEATAAEEENADWWTLLGQFYALRGKWKPAAESFNQSIELKPRQPAVKELLAKARERMDG